MDKSVSNVNYSLNSSQQVNISFNTSSQKYKSSKTPLKTPSKKTPSRIRLGNRTLSPHSPFAADRFIPDRNAMNIELSQYLINNDTNIINEAENKPNTISELIGDLSNFRIISYKNKAPLPPEGHSNNLRVVYSACKTTSTKKPSRYIPNQPERILDAPDIKNDYYLQLIDWSSENILAVALSNEVYLWNSETGVITNLLTLEEPEYVSSLSWAAGGKNIAVGISDGKTQIWDVEKSSRLRNLHGPDLRISCIDWNTFLLSTGSKDGNIYNHDVRIGTSLVGTFSNHSQEVCGLKWSPNHRVLASGGNDNTVNIWSNSLMTQSDGNREPLLTLTDHQAAVKAISWCPWRTNCLATGGGTADRMIRIWNTQNGQNVFSVDTKSQVSAILWSNEYRELISSHGYVNNELIIWKYPTLDKVAELTGHTARILGMAMSPDGSTVVSLGADETLRFWECFQADPATKRTKKNKEIKMKENHSLNGNIR